MKISKSKRKLAQLLTEAGVTQFPEGANWAAQDQNAVVTFFADEPWRCDKCWEASQFEAIDSVTMQSKAIPNWRQTILSRDEFDQIVAAEKMPKHVNCRCTVRSIPKTTTTPTLDQLLQDWRNADDYAQRKQAEADEAAAMRDDRWQAVQARAGEMGVTVARCEPELVINDWRDLRVGDIIKVTGFDGADTISDRELQLLGADSCTVVAADGTNVQIERTDMSAGRCEGWYLNGVLKTQWRFIRRP